MKKKLHMLTQQKKEVKDGTVKNILCNFFKIINKTFTRKQVKSVLWKYARKEEQNNL